MYYQGRYNATIYVSSSKIKSAVKPGASLSLEFKKQMIRRAFETIYRGYSNRKIGAYVGVKDLTISDIQTGVDGYNSIRVKAYMDLFFYMPKVNQIIDFKVTAMDAYNVYGNLYGYKVQIAADQFTNAKATYHAGSNTMTLSSNQKIKEQDVLRARITSINYVIDPVSKKKIALIRATCKNSGAGKI